MRQRNRPGGDFPGAVAFPWGWCSAQRIQNLYDCRWQSYLYYGGPAQAGPDEVEGHRFVTAHGDSRSLRPHQSQLTLRQLLLQEKPFLRSTGPDAQSQWLPLHRGTYASPVSAYGIRCASGHAAAPTCRNDTASRPSSVSADAEPLRNGMTATGSHEYFYSLRGAQPPGEGESQSGQAPASNFAHSPQKNAQNSPTLAPGSFSFAFFFHSRNFRINSFREAG